MAVAPLLYADPSVSQLGVLGVVNQTSDAFKPDINYADKQCNLLSARLFRTTPAISDTETGAQYYLCTDSSNWRTKATFAVAKPENHMTIESTQLDYPLASSSELEIIYQPDNAAASGQIRITDHLAEISTTLRNSDIDWTVGRGHFSGGGGTISLRDATGSGRIEALFLEEAAFESRYAFMAISAAGWRANTQWGHSDDWRDRRAKLTYSRDQWFGAARYQAMQMDNIGRAYTEASQGRWSGTRKYTETGATFGRTRATRTFQLDISHRYQTMDASLEMVLREYEDRRRLFLDVDGVLESYSVQAKTFARSGWLGSVGVDYHRFSGSASELATAGLIATVQDRQHTLDDGKLTLLMLGTGYRRALMGGVVEVAYNQAIPLSVSYHLTTRDNQMGEEIRDNQSGSTSGTAEIDWKDIRQPPLSTVSVTFNLRL